MQSCIGAVTLTSKQAQSLQVEPRSRISPQMERCSLLLSANESFASAEKDIEVLTGMKVSHSTQHRRARNNSVAWGQAVDPVSELSLDGGKVRLRTAKGEESQWRDYKAVALHGSSCGARFQDNEGLADWVGQQPLADEVSVVGDGHPGIWNLAAECVGDGQRREVLDWYHLVENLHKVGGSNQRLAEVREHLWRGEVSDARTAFADWDAKPAANFVSYLERHCQRLPNYAQRQTQGLVIGSGEVESTIKRLASRIKISGAQWLPESVNPMLRLRCAYLNGTLAAA
jgi:hypothetical protein